MAIQCDQERLYTHLRRPLTALAEDLDEDRKVRGRLTIPRLEGLEELKTIALGADDDVDAGPVLGRRLEGILTGVVSLRREFVPGGLGELEWLPSGILEGVGQGVEGQVTSKGHGGDDIGGGDEGVRGGVSVISASEVSVVRCNDYGRG